MTDCVRCHRTITTAPLAAFPPRARATGAVWKPLANVSFCLDCGGNGRNVLTPAEYDAATVPSGQGSLLPEPGPGAPETGPALPYPDAAAGRSSGWSGSATSRERAHREDASGTTSARQRLLLSLLSEANMRGMTWREVAAATGQHHGQASGALSGLHKTGRIARLAERRGRCAVYVLPEFVGTRDVEPHGGKPPVSLRAAWEDGYAEARTMARMYGHTDHWPEDEPTNPYPED
jgi:hypothetical protein